MKRSEANPDETLDRVLTGLREVEPAQGMQQRVLRAARERAGARRPWAPRLPFAAPLSWMFAASFAVVALAASWTLARSHRTAQAPTTHSTARSIPASAPAIETRSGPTSIMETRLGPALVAHPLPTHPRRPSAKNHTALEERASDQESLAVSEMNAPSQPAPPMPLTDEEKLLVQILRKGDPVELAMLDPGLRNSEETGDKADFDRFFKQPPRIVEIKFATNNQPSTGDKK